MLFRSTQENAKNIFPDNRLSGGTTLRQAQLVMLRLLKIFDAICNKYNLQYWLDAGTLLGAARHDGFIPWDDDVDVMMPIEDYNKFLSIAEKELPYDIFFQTKKTDSKHDITWAKLRDRFSYMDDLGGPYPYSQGIPIDIFPAYKQTRLQFKYRNISGLLPPFNNKPMKPSLRYSLKHNAYNIVWGTAQFFMKGFLTIPFIRKKYENKVTTVTETNELGWCYDPERPWFQFFPENVVFPLSKIKFEDYEFSAPANVNEYLTIYYGDWQTPPPESKRDCHSVSGIHITDPGPKPNKHSLNWEEYHNN